MPRQGTFAYYYNKHTHTTTSDTRKVVLDYMVLVQEINTTAETFVQEMDRSKNPYVSLLDIEVASKALRSSENVN